MGLSMESEETIKSYLFSGEDPRMQTEESGETGMTCLELEPDNWKQEEYPVRYEYLVSRYKDRFDLRRLEAVIPSSANGHVTPGIIWKRRMRHTPCLIQIPDTIRSDLPHARYIEECRYILELNKIPAVTGALAEAPHWRFLRQEDAVLPCW